MNSIKFEVFNEIELSKSRFITFLFPVSTEEEAKNHLLKLKKEHKDATHHCYAYLIGEHQEIQKMSDDGEPQKTAGSPMLDVLKKQDMTNVLAVVVRYFGGTLLGAPGLVRAYSKSVSNALLLAAFTTKKSYIEFIISVDYKSFSVIESKISAGVILSKSFDELVTLKIKTPLSNFDACTQEIQNLIHQDLDIKEQKEIIIYE